MNPSNSILARLRAESRDLLEAANAGYVNFNSLSFVPGRGWQAQMGNDDGYEMRVELNRTEPLVPASERNNFAVYGELQDQKGGYLFAPSTLSSQDVDQIKRHLNEHERIDIGSEHEYRLPGFTPDAAKVVLETKGVKIQSGRIVGVVDGRPLSMPVEAAHPSFIRSLEKSLGQVQFGLKTEGRLPGGRRISPFVDSRLFSGEMLSTEPSQISAYLIRAREALDATETENGFASSEELSGATEIIVDGIPTNVPLSTLLSIVLSNPKLLYSMSDALARAGVNTAEFKKEQEQQSKITQQYLSANFIQNPQMMREVNANSRVNILLANLFATGNLTARYWNLLSFSQKNMVRRIAERKGINVLKNGTYLALDSSPGSVWPDEAKDWTRSSVVELREMRAQRIRLGLPPEVSAPFTSDLMLDVAGKLLESIEEAVFVNPYPDFNAAYVAFEETSASPYILDTPRGYKDACKQFGSMYEHDPKEAYNKLRETLDQVEEKNGKDSVRKVIGAVASTQTEKIAGCENIAAAAKEASKQEKLAKENLSQEQKNELDKSKIEISIARGHTAVLAITSMVSTEREISQQSMNDACRSFVLGKRVERENSPYLFKSLYDLPPGKSGNEAIREAVSAYQSINSSKKLRQGIEDAVTIQSMLLHKMKFGSEAEKKEAVLHLTEMLKNPETMFFMRLATEVMQGRADEYGIDKDSAEIIKASALDAIGHAVPAMTPDELQESFALLSGTTEMAVDYLGRNKLEAIQSAFVSEALTGDDSYAPNSFQAYMDGDVSFVSSIRHSSSQRGHYGIDIVAWLGRRVDLAGLDERSRGVLERYIGDKSGLTLDEINEAKAEKIGLLNKLIDNVVSNDERVKLAAETAADALAYFKENAGAETVDSDSIWQFINEHSGLTEEQKERVVESLSAFWSEVDPRYPLSGQSKKLSSEDIELIISSRSRALGFAATLKDDLSFIESAVKNGKGDLSVEADNTGMSSEGRFGRLAFIDEMLESKPNQSWQRIGLSEALSKGGHTSQDLIRQTLTNAALLGIKNNDQDAARLEKQIERTLEEAVRGGPRALAEALRSISKNEGSVIESLKDKLSDVESGCDAPVLVNKIIQGGFKDAFSAAIRKLAPYPNGLSSEAGYLVRNLSTAIIDGHIDENRDHEIKSMLFGDKNSSPILAPVDIEKIREAVVSEMKRRSAQGYRFERSDLSRVSNLLGVSVMPHEISNGHRKLDKDSPSYELAMEACRDIKGIIEVARKTATECDHGLRESHRLAAASAGKMLRVVMRETAGLSAQDMDRLRVSMDQVEVSRHGGEKESLVRIKIMFKDGALVGPPATEIYMKPGIGGGAVNLSDDHVVVTRDYGGEKTSSIEYGSDVNVKALRSIASLVEESSRLGIDLQTKFMEMRGEGADSELAIDGDGYSDSKFLDFVSNEVSARAEAEIERNKLIQDAEIEVVKGQANRMSANKKAPSLS